MIYNIIICKDKNIATQYCYDNNILPYTLFWCDNKTKASKLEKVWEKNFPELKYKITELK